MVNFFSSGTPHDHILLQFPDFAYTNGNATVVLFQGKFKVDINLLNDDTYQFLCATIICVIIHKEHEI